MVFFPQKSWVIYSRGDCWKKTRLWALIAQAEAALVGLYTEQEVGCGSGAASQEAADCITGRDRWRERWRRWIRERPGKALADKWGAVAHVSFWGSWGFYLLVNCAPPPFPSHTNHFTWMLCPRTVFSEEVPAVKESKLLLFGGAQHNVRSLFGSSVANGGLIAVHSRIVPLLLLEEAA